MRPLRRSAAVEGRASVPAPAAFPDCGDAWRDGAAPRPAGELSRLIVRAPVRRLTRDPVGRSEGGHGYMVCGESRKATTKSITCKFNRLIELAAKAAVPGAALPSNLLVISIIYVDEGSFHPRDNHSQYRRQNLRLYLCYRSVTFSPREQTAWFGNSLGIFEQKHTLPN